MKTLVILAAAALVTFSMEAQLRSSETDLASAVEQLQIEVRNLQSKNTALAGELKLLQTKVAGMGCFVTTDGLWWRFDRPGAIVEIDAAQVKLDADGLVTLRTGTTHIDLRSDEIRMRGWQILLNDEPQ